MGIIGLDRLNPKLVSSIEILFLAASATSQNSSVQGERHRQYHATLQKTLIDLGFRVSSSSSLESLLSKPSQQFVYGIHSHSWFNGKEVFTSVLSEYYGLPYLGPPPTIRAVSEDKKLLKLLAQAKGVPTLPEYNLEQFVSGYERISQLGATAYVLKPRNGIASQFIYYFEYLEQLNDILPSLPQRIVDQDMILIEPYIDGINVSVPIVEGIDIDSLPMYEESDDNPQNIITFEGKRGITEGYQRKKYQGELISCLQEYTSLVESEIKPYDYGRLDFRCDVQKGIPYLIDANLICNLSKGAVVATAANSVGVGYRELISHILARSITRQLPKLSDL